MCFAVRSQSLVALSLPRCSAPRRFHASLISSFILSLTIPTLPIFASAQRPSFAVGTASAAPGQKATGYLEVPAGVDAGTNIPVVVVNGAKPGPVLALVTGAHGTEYVSIIAVERLIVELDPARFRARSS